MKRPKRRNVYLVLMAKAPRCGYVKTRLHGEFSQQQACAMYRHFLLRSRSVAETWQRGTEDIHLILAYDPPDQPLLWTDWRAWTKLPQCGVSLGDRLLAVTKSLAFTSGDAIIFIGADAPELTGCHLDWAGETLVSKDAAMVPAHDGGYVLIGLRSSAVALFNGIDWGTDKVAMQTRAIARNAGLEIAESAPVPDIDTADDVAELITRLLCSSNAGDRVLACELLEIINK